MAEGNTIKDLIVHKNPKHKMRTMVVAFAGWPDAAESATTAVKHLVRKLPAAKFAEIDPEEFYDFTNVRPQSLVNEEGEREIHWPTNDFYSYAPDDGSDGLVLYVGTEPNLKWRTFSGILINVAEMCGVEMVVSLGALLDAVPHTREPLITGNANAPGLSQKVEWLGIRSSGYQGPTGIHTAFMRACVTQGLSHASIWGHSPHYLTSSPNSLVSHALLARLRTLVEIDVDLDELRELGEAFSSDVTKAVNSQADVTAYVRKLEERFDASEPDTGEIPSPDTMVAELEEFLRSQRPRVDPQDDQ